MPRFEVWQSPGGKTWEGSDQEEAILAALRVHKRGVITELAEVFNFAGELRLRRVARLDDRAAGRIQANMPSWSWDPMSPAWANRQERTR